MLSYHDKVATAHGDKAYMPNYLNNSQIQRSPRSRGNTSLKCVFVLLIILTLTVTVVGIVVFFRGSKVTCSFSGFFQQLDSNEAYPDTAGQQVDDYKKNSNRCFLHFINITVSVYLKK